ncbi:MAG: Veg family protein [Tissierellia bacterium]|nr:Veg family protein [Tissierellia bacterium]
MQRVEDIKRSLADLVGQEVNIEADRGRNKSMETIGKIANTYPGVFTVEVSFGSESSGIVSYSYTDVLCEKVKITPLS